MGHRGELSPNTLSTQAKRLGVRLPDRKSQIDIQPQLALRRKFYSRPYVR